jgi:hypothetical protein
MVAKRGPSGVCRRGEHAPAGLVQVPGERVDAQYQPGSEPAKLLRARTHPGVEHGTFGVRERTGQPANRLRRDARNPAVRSGG